ncbi:PTS system mannose/fructose/sorbose family transporter subunit IID, partial [Eubacteriales bacterium OttesenSCG-928-N14]|nr:PTS system mannose/fructose/sorbose family transporter subunit IID [Eubacteriales bacterium OttesenSCG-928-N14]
YRDEDEYRAALKRHLHLFSTNPTMGSFVVGIVLAAEESNRSYITEEAIHNMKITSGQMLIAINDAYYSFFSFGILTLAAFRVVDHQQYAFAVGIILLNGIVLILLSRCMLGLGYTCGRKAIQKLSETGWLKTAMHAMGIVGCTMLGVMVARYSRIEVQRITLIEADPSKGREEPYFLDLQKDFFDKLLLGILPLSMVLASYWLQKRGVNRYILLIAIVLIFTVLNYFEIIRSF